VRGTSAFLLVSQLPDDQLNAWGSRIPFLASFLMTFVTLSFRLRVKESPVFEPLRERRQVVKLPVIETIKRYPKLDIGLEKLAQDALVSAPKVAKEEKPMEPVAS
jgi:hypothetical protein